MKVIIAGSRHMHPSTAPMMNLAIQKSGFTITEVVCGLAKGADLMGAEWAYYSNIPVKEFPANWDIYGKAAGTIRNKQMADYADAAIVFIWDESRGSANMIKQMQQLNKPVFVVHNGVL